MKILKKIVYMIVLVMIVIALAYNIVFAATLSKDADVTNASANYLNNYENVYCVQYGQLLDSSVTYYRRTIITIQGDTVYFYQQGANGSGQITGKVKEGWGNTTEANNILAAILYNQQGYGKVNAYHTDTQKGVFQYWSTWLSESGAGSYGVAGSGHSSEVGASVVSDATERAQEHEYSVEIHFLEHVLHKKQRLIAVYDIGRTKKIPPTIDITVSKYWNDEGDKYKNRTPVTVKLLLNGADTGNSLTLQEPGWSGTFTGLENATGYSVVETSGPNGYITSYSGSQSGGFSIENTLKRVNIKFTKIWDDDKNRDGKRPESIIVQACDQKGTVIKEEVVSKDKSNVSGDGTQWTYEIVGLPQYVKGVKIEYTIKEKSVPQEYYLVD